MHYVYPQKIKDTESSEDQDELETLLVNLFIPDM